MLKLARRLLEIALGCLVVSSLGLAIAAQAGPLGGYGLYAVRSASMAPAVGIGDLVVVERVDPALIQPGDVVTLAVAGGRAVTHRVVRVTQGAGEPTFTTKGDANATADATPVAAEQLRGRVAWRVPMLGYLLAMITMPTGVIALFSIGATLLVALWLLEELEASDHEEVLSGLAHRRAAARRIAIS